MSYCFWRCPPPPARPLLLSTVVALVLVVMLAYVVAVPVWSFVWCCYGSLRGPL